MNGSDMRLDSSDMDRASDDAVLRQRDALAKELQRGFPYAISCLEHPEIAAEASAWLHRARALLAAQDKQGSTNHAKKDR